MKTPAPCHGIMQPSMELMMKTRVRLSTTRPLRVTALALALAAAFSASVRAQDDVPDGNQQTDDSRALSVMPGPETPSGLEVQSSGQQSSAPEQNVPDE